MINKIKPDNYKYILVIKENNNYYNNYIKINNKN